MDEIKGSTLFSISKGSPLPYGANFRENGYNFSLFSKHATSVTLCLFYADQLHPCFEFALNPNTHKTGDVWHVHVYGLTPGMHYGYRIDGPFNPEKGERFNPNILLIDPYAIQLSQSTEWGNTDEQAPMRAVLAGTSSYNWKEDKHPCIPIEEMIIYEMHVRGFTQHSSSKVDHPGTFLGVIEKIPYLKSLGVNAVELLPIHIFNECEYIRKASGSGNNLYNYWGYSTINFFAPMNRYTTRKDLAIYEFKEMVAALHQAGIEVILDVVFNHTAEGGEHGPVLNFRGIENSTYYILDDEGKYLNFSGCGNTFNCNHPVARELIRISLRYWVAEMHVDGFRFDLASILGRATDGKPLANPPLLEMIALDPILAKTKLIAEAWDAAGLYQVGSFPSWGVWAEWNGKYRDHVRRFIKGTPGVAGSFATRICGSPDLYAAGRTPGHSINFITAHDGFTLSDLVSYNEKHNLENGEDNRDGSNQNDSWNCGAEGDTQNKEILHLRERQMRNFHVALMVSQGVPMFLMGDEYGHTKKGNNNTWCQDNILNWFLWDKTEKNSSFFRFFKLMIAFRKKHALLSKAAFLTDQDIKWHGISAGMPSWGFESQFVAFVLKDNVYSKDLYIAFNAINKPASVELPPRSDGQLWHRIVDTQQTSPEDFIEEESSCPITSEHYVMAPYSSIIFKALPT